MILNNADNIKVGISDADRVYVGNTLVWEHRPQYRYVEYIESTGTQYIETDIVPSLTDKTILDIKFGSKLNDGGSIDNSYLNFYGSRGYFIKFGHWNSTNRAAMDFYLGYGWSSSLTNYSVESPFSPTITTRQNIIAERGNSSYGGKSCNANATVTLTPQEGLLVFGYVGNGAIFEYKGYEMYLYGTKIYSSSDVLLHDLVPAERSDGELGLYDIITDKFYGNAGTGTFIKGDYVPDPTVYQSVNYIKSTGTQYITTNIVPDVTDKVVVDIQFGSVVDVSTGPTLNLIGVRGFSVGFTHFDDNSEDMNFFLGYSWYSGMSASIYQISSPANKTQRQNLTIVRGNSTYGNKSCSANASVTITPSSPIDIFGYYNDNSDQHTPYRGFEMSVYGVKIYDSSNVLTHNLVPLKRIADGELGLYDTITDTFYSNSGTGTFIEG